MENELKAFEDAKTGVTKIPQIFIHEIKNTNFDQINSSSSSIKNKKNPGFSIPVIDLHLLHHHQETNKNSTILEKLRDACEKWGFFQVVNHGIPDKMMDDMIQGIKLFNEEEEEEEDNVEMMNKKTLYSCDSRKNVVFNSNIDRKNVVFNSNIDMYYSRPAVWRDSLTCKMSSPSLSPQELPSVCRDITIEYSKHLKDLACNLFGLISESLGLEKSHLTNIGCAEGLLLKGHYYPPCPQPELTFGTIAHTDNVFLTILLQDHIGGLQVLHENEWVDVQPLHGALIVNLGDFLQILTNDKFKSVRHRVLANKVGPRISVACFFRPHEGEEYTSRVHGPIKELLSKKNPPLYKHFTIEEYTKYFISQALDGEAALSHFKLRE